MGWDDVKPGGAGGNFLKIAAGQKVLLHVFSEEPYSFKQAFFNDVQRGAILDDETVKLVDKKLVRAQHALWVRDFSDNSDKVWMMSNATAEQVKNIFETYGTLAEIDLVVARMGSGLQTKYQIVPKQTKFQDDVPALEDLSLVLVAETAENVERLLRGEDPNVDFDPNALEAAAPTEAAEEDATDTAAPEPAADSVDDWLNETPAKPAPVARPAARPAPAPAKKPAPAPAARPQAGASPNGTDRAVLIKRVMALPKLKDAKFRAMVSNKVAKGKTLSQYSVAELQKVLQLAK